MTRDHIANSSAVRYRRWSPLWEDWDSVTMVSDAYMPTHSRANPVDEVITIDSSVESLIDVDSGVSVVDSDFLEREVITPEPFS